MKILLLGKGFLGTKILDYFKCDFLDKRIENMVSEDFEGYDVVINTIAKANVDWCEENEDVCFDTNTRQAIRIAKLVKGKYVFVSTGCIFPEPLCEYAWSKFFAEIAIRELKENHLIIRPRLLISTSPHPKNTIDKILSYPVLSTSPESMTIIEDMLPELEKLLRKDAKGTFNIVNEGTISPSYIATIFKKDHIRATHDEIQDKSGKVRRTSIVLKSDVRMPDIINRIQEIYEN